MNVGELYKLHADYLIKYVNRKYQGKVSAEDVVQDVFLDYFMQGYQNIENPIALLIIMTRNIAFNHNMKRFYKGKSRLRQGYLEDMALMAEDCDWDAVIVDPNTIEIRDEYPQHDERKKVALKAIEKLPRMQRKIMGYKLNNMTNNQIARWTKKTPSAARFSTHKALKVLTERCQRTMRMAKKFNLKKVA